LRHFCWRRRKIELREFALPEIDENSGLAKIEITGVCGADWPIYTGDLAKFAPPPLIRATRSWRAIERIGKRAAARWGVNEATAS